MKNIWIIYVLIVVITSGCIDKVSELNISSSEELNIEYDCELVGLTEFIRIPTTDWADIRTKIESNSFDFVNDNGGLIGAIHTDIYNIKFFNENKITSNCEGAGCKKVSCYFYNSLINNDMNICSFLPKSINVTHIKTWKFEVDESNISLNYKDMCLVYHLINRKLSDEKFCSLLEIPDATWEGYSRGRLTTKDICYQHLAIDNNDPSLCFVTQNSPHKSSYRINETIGFCLARLYIVRGNIDACKLMGGVVLDRDDRMDNCYLNVAIMNNNSEICNFIQQEDKKNQCLSKFSSD